MTCRVHFAFAVVVALVPEKFGEKGGGHSGLDGKLAGREGETAAAGPRNRTRGEGVEKPSMWRNLRGPSAPRYCP